jgi:hypothetical protein
MGPEWPKELIDECTKKLADGISAEIDEEIMAEIYGIPLDEEKREARRKQYNDEITLAELEQYFNWIRP